VSTSIAPTPSRTGGPLTAKVAPLLAAPHNHHYYRTTGHVWQGRFKAFPVEHDDHLVTVLRYVERNVLRANWCRGPRNWKWSSVPRWLRRDSLLCTGQVPVRDKRWLERINEPLSARGTSTFAPLCSSRPAVWKRIMDCGYSNSPRAESCLRPRGRPRKDNVKALGTLLQCPFASANLRRRRRCG